jgi:hypothetical protein
MGGFVTMPSSNRLLRLLDGEAFDSLSPVAVQLRAREVLCEPGMPALHVYFPISAGRVHRFDDGEAELPPRSLS